MKQPLIVLTGPTAVGKTNLSIKLAKRIGGAIISADSIQVYKYMDIGSAKIMPEEMDGVKHYLVDCLDPAEAFDIVRFQTMAKDACEEIYANGKIPIIVGGTGFYIQSLLYGISFEEEDEDTSYREEYYRIAEKEGPEVLHAMLAEVDPKSAEVIHANNVKRVARALEFYQKNNFPIFDHNMEQREKEAIYNFEYFVLNDDRKKLYNKIEQRIDLMMEQGLLDEVKKLKDMGYDRSLVSMQGLGYKEILAYLDEECTLEDAVRILKRDTRHFAKRQLTWFRREKTVTWIEKEAFEYDENKMLDYMIACLKEKGIIS